MNTNSLSIIIKRFSIEWQSNYNGQSQQTKTTQRTNENSKQIHITSAKRGKTRATKSRFVLVLHLIGWEGGASILNQSQITFADYFRHTIKPVLFAVKCNF